MAAVSKDLLIEQGATFTHTFIRRDSNQVGVSLSGFDARLQIREDIENSTVLLELTNANGGIILEAGGVDGKIELYIGATATELITWVAGVYDLELVETADPDNVVRLTKGSFVVDPEITR